VQVFRREAGSRFRMLFLSAALALIASAPFERVGLTEFVEPRSTRVAGRAPGERGELLLGAVAARGEKEIDRPRGVRFDLRAQGG
jgi:hypothetical protein